MTSSTVLELAPITAVDHVVDWARDLIDPKEGRGLGPPLRRPVLTLISLLAPYSSIDNGLFAVPLVAKFAPPEKLPKLAVRFDELLEKYLKAASTEKERSRVCHRAHDFIEQPSNDHCPFLPVAASFLARHANEAWTAEYKSARIYGTALINAARETTQRNDSNKAELTASLEQGFIAHNQVLIDHGRIERAANNAIYGLSCKIFPSICNGLLETLTKKFGPAVSAQARAHLGEIAADRKRSLSDPHVA